MEFKDNAKKIYIHIPSGAVLKKDNLHNSYSDFKKFITEYFPEYNNTELFCDSWLLSPALNRILPESSKILFFRVFLKLLVLISQILVLWIGCIQTKIYH
jgi:hypothetical protein